MSALPTDIFTYGSLAMPAYGGGATLSAAITLTTSTTFAINAPTAGVDGTFFPVSGEFLVEIDTELFWVTQASWSGTVGQSTATFTVIRGFAGSTAATHLINAAVNLVSGGPVDFLTGVAFTDIGSGDTLDAISSSASDTKVIVSVIGRNAGGNLVGPLTGTLNGQTAITGVGSSQVFNRLLTLGLGPATIIATTALTAAATSLTIASATNLPASGTCKLLIGREVISVTSGLGTTTLTITRPANATTHAIGDNVYLMPFGDVAVYDHTAVISAHTAQTGAAQSVGTTPALFKLQSGDGGTVQVGQLIVITNNLPSGVQSLIRTITDKTSYGTDIVAVDRDWDVLPTASTTYNVVKGWKLPFEVGSGVAGVAALPMTNMQRFMWGAVADIPAGSPRVYYEKIFAVNNNTATDLTSVTIQDSGNTPALPGSALLDIALAKNANSTFAAAGRLTLPTNDDTTALAFVTQPSPISVIANSQAIVHGAAPNAAGAQGIWMRATLPAGTTAYNGSANLRTLGNTI